MFISLKELLEKRADLIKKQRETLNKLKDEKRDFTAKEREEYDARDFEIDDLSVQIRETELKQFTPGGRLEDPNYRHRGSENSFMTAEGTEVRALKVGETFGHGRSGLSLTRIVRGLVTGRWEGADAEARAMTSASGAAGGYLVPQSVSATVIDLARSKSVTQQAGALSFQMDSGEVTIAKIASDPTAAWRSENSAIPESAPTFEPVSLVAQTLGCLVTMPIELLEDAQISAATVENAIAQAMALELDRVALRGSGVGEPRGLYNTPGVNELSMGTNGASLTSYGKFSEAVELIANANGTARSVVYAPRTAGALDRLADSTGQPLQPPPSFVALQKYSTTQIPVNLTQGSASNCSFAMVGDFSGLVFGMRTQLALELSRASGDAFSKLQVQIRAYLRADIAVLQPGHFTIIKGIKA